MTGLSSGAGLVALVVTAVIALAWPATASAAPAGSTSFTSMAYHRGGGYWAMVDGSGLQGVGGAPVLGPSPARNATVVANPVGTGYWLVERNGSVHAYGEAPSLGTFPDRERYAPGVHTYLSGGIDAAAATPTGKGLYGVDSQGHVWTLGDAVSLGDASKKIGSAYPAGIVVSTNPATGQIGYWIGDTAGGVYSFGVKFQGSTGGRGAYDQYSGFAGTTGGQGYCLLSASGSLTAFGDAAASGCSGSFKAPVNDFTGIALKPGGGYGVIRERGQVFETPAPAAGPGGAPSPHPPWCRGWHRSYC